ncbi:putative uncharacterized protein [Dorea sp. CAG:317]|nr:putative uncharacterized protein [Dorea sp. CAG:317]
MREQMERKNRKEKKTKNSKVSRFVSRNFGTILKLALLMAIVAAIGVGVCVINVSESKTTKIGFEDIGEMATQSAYCTEVNVTEDAKELYGMRIPFTQSKYIYSYDIVIKAGYDFNEIEWKEKNKTIEVKLPEAKVLSNELDMDSFKVYHEEESIFSKITLEENNDAVKKMKLNAQENAIANGLLENARSNAETMLTGFFADEYDLDEYKIVFKDK